MSTKRDIVPADPIDATYKLIAERSINESELSGAELRDLQAIVQRAREHGEIQGEDVLKLSTAAPRLLAMVVGMRGRCQEIIERGTAQMPDAMHGHFGGANMVTTRINVARHIMGDKSF